VVRELLRIDPQMTAERVRAQRLYIEGAWFSEFLAALRIAGLPD
jgi:hypothetical protein